jgi:hypothetical protein
LKDYIKKVNISNNELESESDPIIDDYFKGKENKMS